MRTQARSAALRALVAAVLLVGFGCATSPSRASFESRLDDGELPPDFPSLLSVAYAAYSDLGPGAAVERSLAAAEQALALHPDHELASFLAARAALWLLELGDVPPGSDARELAGRGHRHAQTALGLNPDRAEYVFLSGALLGYRIQHRKLSGLVRLGRVHEAFERAAELDPGYADGAPLRALGTLLVKAPAWPRGVGDPERGIETLERAAALFPGHPANHLYLAEALVEEGRNEEAAGSVQKVLELCGQASWGAVCAAYLPRARSLQY